MQKKVYDKLFFNQNFIIFLHDHKAFNEPNKIKIVYFKFLKLFLIFLLNLYYDHFFQRRHIWNGMIRVFLLWTYTQV